MSYNLNTNHSQESDELHQHKTDTRAHHAHLFPFEYIFYRWYGNMATNTVSQSVHRIRDSSTSHQLDCARKTLFTSISRKNQITLLFSYFFVLYFVGISESSIFEKLFNLAMHILSQQLVDFT